MIRADYRSGGAVIGRKPCRIVALSSFSRSLSCAQRSPHVVTAAAVAARYYSYYYYYYYYFYYYYYYYYYYYRLGRAMLLRRPAGLPTAKPD